MICKCCRNWRGWKKSWLEKDEVVSRLASKGRDFTESDKEALKAKEIELIGLVLPAHREAARARTDRTEHDAFLSSDSAADLRFGHCAGGESVDAVAAAGLPASGRCAGTIAAGAGIS